MEGVTDELNEMNINTCASCSKTDDNLKACTACRMVKYCNRECQIADRKNHKKDCKKHAAELFDEQLFKQTSSNPLGDCPVCFLPMPREGRHVSYQVCCGQTICSGCLYWGAAMQQRNQRGNNSGTPTTCAFCRAAPTSSDKEFRKQLQKRLDANDPQAYLQLGGHYQSGARGFPRNLDRSIESFNHALQLGGTQAHHMLGHAYHEGGQGVEVDKKKGLHHFQVGAMAGNINCRRNLGFIEHTSGNRRRAMRHYLISAAAGDVVSMEEIQKGYRSGHVTKDEFEKALRAHKEASDEVKSEQREVIGRLLDNVYQGQIPNY